MHRFNRGFTLIEIMIVIAIIGIIITIAAPSFTEYLNKGRRAEVASLLSEQAQILERFYSQKQRLHRCHRSERRQRLLHHYPDDDRSDIPADRHPQAGTSMAADKCGDFTMTNTGVSGMVNATTGLTTKDCWGR
jgi:type IV pilus assembly protein PilE